MNTQDLFNLFVNPSFTNLRLAQPRALYLLGVVGVALILWLWQAAGIRRWPAPILRALTLALFVLALADPQTVARSQGVTRPVMVDASASITPAMRDYTVSLLHDQLKLRSGDPAMLFGSAVVDSTVGEVSKTLLAPEGCASCAPQATDLGVALNALAANPAAHDGPIVLVTDGWQNRGTLETALDAIKNAGIKLYVFSPPGASAIPNIAMTQLALPPALAKAESFTVGVTLNNLNANEATGTVQLSRDGNPLDQREVRLAPGQTRIDFPVRAEAAGLTVYKAVFKPSNPAMDTYTEDDSLEGWIGIGAQRKVLIITDVARDATYLEAAVRQLGLQPSLVTLNGGTYDGNPKGYDAIILNNVARSHLSASAQNALVQYVSQGGSLAMVGGDQSFGLGGYAGSGIAQAMPVIMKPPEHHERKRALILVIDKSGSMGRNDKLTYAKLAARTVTKKLNDTDMIGVIGFDSQPFEVIPLRPVSELRPYFNEMIDRLKAHGQTYMLPALQEANRALSQSGASIKHVIVLTDGETGGTAAMYYDLVSSMHHEGSATVSAIAIGREANLPLLEAIAKYGGGGFYQTDSPENLPDLFLEDVKQRGGADTTMVEKDFTPYTVTPDPILKDMAGRRLPALKGFVSTELKPGASLSVYVNSNDRRDPILASWKYGSGKSLALTTDASGRWSSEWVRDGVFSSLWDKVIAWMTPQTQATQKFDIALGYRAGRVAVNLTDYSDNAEASPRPVDAVVTTPEGARFETVLTQQAPGELSGSFEAPKPGRYNIELKQAHGAGFTFPPLAYTVTPAVNAEVPRPAPNYGLLEHLASATGGRLNPAPEELALSRPTFEQHASLNPWLIVSAMILLILEALVRRLTF
ncbi:MAG TPA: VWA domain-containing protein [Candidatus Binataceae bacterium]|nr:VWA domain-containing protein [Candidatus Binataceae bacterium]